MPSVLHHAFTTAQPPVNQAVLTMDDLLLNYLDDTVSLLCRISEFPHALYSVVIAGKRQVRGFFQQKFVNVTQRQDNLLEESSLSISALSPLGRQLQSELQQQFGLLVQSMSNIHYFCRGFGQEVNILLFSELIQHMTETTWQTLQDYVAQRTEGAGQLLAAHDLQLKVEHLETVNLGRAKYFSVIAHDLRAPFHGILGCADILAHERDTLDDAAQQRLADYVHDTAQTTYGLLENLLNWSMAEGGRFHQRPVYFDLKDRVRFVVDLLSALAFKKQICLTYDIEDGLMLYGDRNMLTSMIQNITSNALKFTPPNGDREVNISARRDGHEVEIVIADQGVGMTQEQMDKLFRDYAIASTNGTLGEKGTGLGLLLSRRFIEWHHGSLKIESEIGVGSRFIIRLPVEPESATDQTG